MNENNASPPKKLSSRTSAKPRSGSGKSLRITRSLTRRTNAKSIASVNCPVVMHAIGLYLEAKADQDYRLDNGKDSRPPKCRK